MRDLSVLFINVQRVGDFSFDDFQFYLESLRTFLEVICPAEHWLTESNLYLLQKVKTGFKLPSYFSAEIKFGEGPVLLPSSH